jgi:hypothetical protein
MNNDMEPDDIIDKANQLIDKYKGIENAILFVQQKIDELNTGFKFKGGQSMEFESIRYWVHIMNELEFKIELN